VPEDTTARPTANDRSGSPLAVTGAEPTGLAALATGLIVAGAAALGLRRRRA
jgi:LPXTG-motif cell wall-anchored protein